MIFAKIDYINLLPLHIYMKKYPLPSGIKKAMAYKSGVPSKMNQALANRLIDASMISSIESFKKKYKTLDVGICANKKVLSVLVCKNTSYEKDSSSATSNALAKILRQEGRVLIGDKALKAYLENKELYIDLCELWYEKTGLPFVFGRFSCLKHKDFYERMLKNFLKAKIKIPNYILEKYEEQRGICKKDIKEYLKLIYYKIGVKEKRALKKFQSLLKST